MFPHLTQTSIPFVVCWEKIHSEIIYTHTHTHTPPASDDDSVKWKGWSAKWEGRETILGNKKKRRGKERKKKKKYHGSGFSRLADVGINYGSPKINCVILFKCVFFFSRFFSCVEFCPFQNVCIVHWCTIQIIEIFSFQFIFVCGVDILYSVW